MTSDVAPRAQAPAAELLAALCETRPVGEAVALVARHQEQVVEQVHERCHTVLDEVGTRLQQEMPGLPGQEGLEPVAALLPVVHAYLDESRALTRSTMRMETGHA